MIIRLCEDTPKVAFRIVQPGCSGAQLLCDDIEIAIRSAACCNDPEPYYRWEGCEYVQVCPEPAVPTLRYKAFEIDDDGRVVFYFDSKLWTLPSGRYIGTISVLGHCGKPIDIDLCNRPLIIDQVAVTSVTPCGSDSC